MRFDFGLNKIELELSQAKENLVWIPTIPARDLEDYKGRRVKITPEYLQSAASETKRFYADRNDTFRLPILCAHDDNGRRSGSLVDFAVRKYKDVDTLFVKADFLDESYNAVLSGSLAHGSISILPEYIDPQSGKKYGPFIKEWSETHAPVVKDFTISELLETPSQLAMLNLTLSEDNMDNEELLAAVEATVTEMISPILERLDALEGGEEEEVEETEEEEAPEAVAASEVDPVLTLLGSIVERMEGLEKTAARAERVRAKGVQKSTTGVPIAASENKKTLTYEQKMKKQYDKGLTGLAAVKARIEEFGNE